MGSTPQDARNGLCKLPVFRPVALKMFNLLANEQADVPRLVDLLRSDPALSAQVLTVANSALYGNAQTIDNLGRAILVMGFERTRSLTLTVALRSVLQGVRTTRWLTACWQHSLAAALVAEELAPLYEVTEDGAYTAGLLHDVGRLGLLVAYGDQYGPVLGSAHNHAADCLKSERDLFQMDHCQAGFWLAQRWGLPVEYSRVAGCHHDDLMDARPELTPLSHVACRLADALGFAAVTLAQAPSTEEIVRRLPVPPWRRYQFDEDAVKSRIAHQIASVEIV